jgi:hypothetical protein
MTKHLKLLAFVTLGIGSIVLGPAAQVATAQYPNPIVSSTTSTFWRWDYYQQRWVQDVISNQTTASRVIPGANSIVPGTYSKQTYWDGSRYITVERWIGADGQWHSNQTVVTPNATGGQTSQSTLTTAQPGQPVESRNRGGRPGASDPRPGGRQDHRSGQPGIYVITPNATGGTTSQSMFVNHGGDQPVAQRNNSGQPGVSNPRPGGRHDHRHRNK